MNMNEKQLKKLMNKISIEEKEKEREREREREREKQFVRKRDAAAGVICDVRSSLVWSTLVFK